MTECVIGVSMEAQLSEIAVTSVLFRDVLKVKHVVRTMIIAN